MRIADLKHHWPWVALAIVGVTVPLAWWLRSGSNDAPNAGPVVVRPDIEVTAQRPTTTKPSVGTRVARHHVAPSRIVTAGTPDTTRVRLFARKVFEAESLRAEVRRLKAAGRDTGQVGQVRAVLPPVSGAYDGRRLTLWLSRSDGSVLQTTARLKPRFDFLSGADKGTDTVPLFTEDRWWLRQSRELLQCSKPVAAVALAALALASKRDRWRIVGLAGGGALVACMAD